MGKVTIENQAKYFMSTANSMEALLFDSFLSAIGPLHRQPRGRGPRGAGTA